jgi:hypothetical protein
VEVARTDKLARRPFLLDVEHSVLISHSQFKIQACRSHTTALTFSSDHRSKKEPIQRRTLTQLSAMMLCANTVPSPSTQGVATPRNKVIGTNKQRRNQVTRERTLLASPSGRK